MATPLASLLGVKETVRLKAPHNPTLESYYCNITKNPTQVDFLTHPHTMSECCVTCPEILNSDLSVPAPVLSSEPLQADRLLGKTSAAMVQETEEPRQAEFAQEVSGGQVNAPIHF